MHAILDVLVVCREGFFDFLTGRSEDTWVILLRLRWLFKFGHLLLLSQFAAILCCGQIIVDVVMLLLIVEFADETLPVQISKILEELRLKELLGCAAGPEPILRIVAQFWHD